MHYCNFKFWVWSILIFALISFFNQCEAKLSCKNENGQDVDWVIFYKLPKSSKSSNKIIAVGEAYSYLEVPVKGVATGQWVLSERSAKDPDSIFGRTYRQLEGKAAKGLAYIIYNDQEPSKNGSSNTYGHTKGILATDGTTGFWLIHSVPNYPPSPDEENFDFPDSGRNNAQTGLCITVNFDTVKEIINLMRYNKPNIYAKKSNSDIDALEPELKNFFTDDRAIYAKKEPFSISTDIQTLGGQNFVAFAKHAKWEKDLFDDAVAPGLKASLLVQTWRSGAGNKLSADCSRSPYSVYNVDEVQIDFKGKTDPDILPFPRTNDHSKWAIAQEGYPPWVCVGDINRMESQRKRGGGAVCVKNASAWKAYKAIIDKYETCSLNKGTHGQEEREKEAELVPEE